MVIQGRFFVVGLLNSGLGIPGPCSKIIGDDSLRVLIIYRARSFTVLLCPLHFSFTTEERLPLNGSSPPGGLLINDAFLARCSVSRRRCLSEIRSRSSVAPRRGETTFVCRHLTATLFGDLDPFAAASPGAVPTFHSTRHLFIYLSVHLFINLVTHHRMRAKRVRC